MKTRLRIGFVASRLMGTDGVSLEAGKWLEVLNRLGCECFCFCARTDWPEERAVLHEAAGLLHEDNRKINTALFREKRRTDSISRLVDSLKHDLKGALRTFVDRFGIELLIAENALSLPMNIPLGLAVAEYIGESGVRTIGHHHDFWWERDRYASSPAEDYLRGAFPVTLDAVRHVVINSVAERELAFRTGAKSALVPNVMDFANPPEDGDGYVEDMRDTLGIKPDQRMILQPTRIVPRKRIEKAIELVRRLHSDSVLVVTHEAGDEGYAYAEYLRELAELMNVVLLMPSERFDIHRRRMNDGGKVYSLQDAYRRADLVTYCSAIEGFGNAFLETIYYKRPLIMSAYEIFSLDIRPKGFKVLSFQDFIPAELVERTERLLADPGQVEEWAETNYRLGEQYYSLESLEKRLVPLIEQCVGRC
ncbi:MAG: glycosyltransferase family 4 protein [Lentisphaerae bacterium]|nr:glycosyltransferase family 4 protein [Lentisphaerota bacterium]